MVWTTHRHPGIHCFASGRHTLAFRTEHPSTPPSHPSANQSLLLPAIKALGIIQGNPRKPCNHIDRTRHQLCKRPNCMAKGNKKPTSDELEAEQQQKHCSKTSPLTSLPLMQSVLSHECPLYTILLCHLTITTSGIVTIQIDKPMYTAPSPTSLIRGCWVVHKFDTSSVWY
jgi:hypothetical protein